MHRSTTTAALLVSAAVTAVTATVSGCVSVERPAGTGPVAATTSAPAPHPDGSSRPRVVQAPAREALERMGTPPGPATSRPTAPEAARSTPPPGPARPARPPAPAPSEPARRPPPARPDAGATRPAPATAPAAPGADVCALGEAYGNWPPGSAQAVICRETYGR
ncbi:hypothetical protein ACFVYR_11085 [Streptomyces sp. NPDC058284]|uniref:hypothetical protein n=1 Tax=unclassified Streptomyces TaxID=2593676 RepID=UPI0036581D1C